MAKWLIVSGIVLILIGVAWPWLSRLGLGQLPGDIRIEGKGYRFFFPITTSILISLVLSILLWIIRK